jgi:glycosyltransferase involved in cell wall biosynthesis
MVTLFPPEQGYIPGGVAGVAFYLANELTKKEGIKLSIVVPRKDRSDTVCENWGKYKVYKLGINRLASALPGIIYNILWGGRKLHRLLRELKPDLVHFQGYTYFATHYGSPNVLTIHGIAENDARWEKNGLLRYCLHKINETLARRRVKNLILISKYVEEFLPKKNDINKIWAIENPIADSYFDVNWDYQAGRILFCAKLTRRKNPLGMVRAFALIAERYPDAQLRFAGNEKRQPDYVAECKRFTKASNLQDRVHFLGNLSVDSVQDELSKANCLVLPSFQETAPLAIEEAMAVGVPVVTSGICGMPYMVEDGETGFLIDPHNTEDIAESVCKILSDDNLAMSMSQRAQKAARERFRASVVCEKTLLVYKEILSQDS